MVDKLNVVQKLEWAEDSEPILRKALASPWWRLRFDDVLEERFNQIVAALHAKHVRINYILAVFFVDMFAFADYYFLPDVYQIAWLLRFALITPIFAIAIWFEFIPKRNYHREWVTLLLLFVTTTTLMLLFSMSTSPDVAHYQVCLIAIMVFSNLLTNMRTVLALPASIAFAAMYLLEITVGLHLPGHLVGNYGMFMALLVALSMVACYRRERHQRTVFLMLALLDIAEQRQSEAHAALQKLASLDPLTGLANRRSFDEEYPRLWKEGIRQSQPLSILFVDLDRFKAYNDTYGHAQGDEALRRFAEVLRETATRRPLDMAVRNGGEEFLIVLPDTPLDVAVNIAQALVTRLSGLAIAHKASSFGVLTASVGVAGGQPRAGLSPQVFVEQADEAMYKAKDGGRNRVESVAV